MANVKVTCPHRRRQTWVRAHYNDPCEHCGKAVPDPHIKSMRADPLSLAARLE
jgi:hypothetical protein